MHRTTQPDPPTANGGAFPVSIPADALAGLIRRVVEETLAAVERDRAAVPDGKLAFTEAEAARLLSLNPWQLRGERRLGRIRASAGPAGKILYSREDLLEYLRARRWEGAEV